MESFDPTLNRGRKLPFDEVPDAFRRRAFGVDYIRLAGAQTGELFVTRMGWASIDSIMPSQWFAGEAFSKVGRALAGATGAVYRVPVKHHARSDCELVVKFSRAGQDIGITVVEEGLDLDGLERSRIAQAEFLSPFEEFGKLHALRRAARSLVRTKQALAIYCPPTRYLAWQLGRKPHLCQRMSDDLARSQEEQPPERRIAYEWDRTYILLYGWIRGFDAEFGMLHGGISKREMIALAQHARRCMRSAGWMVCDHKPRHVILRQSKGGSGIVRRNGEPVWALIDYELLTEIPPQEIPQNPE
jgi:hypothetical protein